MSSSAVRANSTRRPDGSAEGDTIRRPMSFPVRARLLVAAVLALAAGAAAGWRVAPIEPYLEVSAIRRPPNESYDLWDGAVKARRGEATEETSLEAVPAPAPSGGKMPRIANRRSGRT